MDDATIASVDDYLMQGIRLSGTTTESWIKNIQKASGKYLLAKIEPNISQSGDGSKPARQGTVDVFFVDDATNQRIKIGTQECGSTAITVNQCEFTGYCPSCESMNVDKIVINDDGYGDRRCEAPGGYFERDIPAYYKTNENIDLLECELLDSVINVDGRTVQCFELSASTNQTTELKPTEFLNALGNNRVSEIYVTPKENKSTFCNSFVFILFCSITSGLI